MHTRGYLRCLLGGYLRYLLLVGTYIDLYTHTTYIGLYTHTTWGIVKVVIFGTAGESSSAGLGCASTIHAS